MSFPHERPEQIDTCIRCLRDTLRLPAATNTTTYAVCAECAAKQWAEEQEWAEERVWPRYGRGPADIFMEEYQRRVEEILTKGRR